MAEGKWFEKPPDVNKTFEEMIEKYLTEYSISKTPMHSKNKERRTIPLNHDALEVLVSKAKVKTRKNGFVFATSVETKIERRNLLRAFYIAEEKAEVENFVFTISGIPLRPDWLSLVLICTQYRNYWVIRTSK